MADISPETAIRQIFDSDNPAFENPYDPNVALGVAPWWLPLGDIWAHRHEPTTDGDVLAAREYLEELHAEYREACR